MRGRWRLAGVAVFASAGAAAHDLGTSPVHPVLDPLPAALHGVTVEVAETLAPQLLVGNRGDEVLTVLDEQGRPFVRIGRQGVEADLNAHAWYRSLSTGSVPEPASAKDPASPPRWAAVGHEPALGWFDPRLAVGAHGATPAMRKADAPASTGTWRVPVLLGSVRTAITGQFRYEPPADGAYVTRLVPPAGFPADVTLLVSQGAMPAILLLDPRRRDVTLIGMQGEDEVRLGGQGVFANTRSPTWRHWSQTERAAVPTDPDGWTKVSAGASTCWLEPRGATRATGDAHPDVHWTLPVRVEGVTYAIAGVATWKDAEAKVAAR